MQDIIAQTESYDRNRSPSFVDLRDFADRRWGDIPSRDDFLASRHALSANGEESPVGLIALDAANGAVEALPLDEFIIVLVGRLHLAGNGQDLSLTAGDAAVLGQGLTFSWSADDGTVIIYLRYPESNGSAAMITPIRKDPPLEPSGKPAPEILLGPAPDCRNFNDYRVDGGRFVCGTWDSTAYRRSGFLYGHYEIMHLTQGSVTLSDQGRTQLFSQGDTILAERGSHCSWDSSEHVAKIFAIYR
jgi:uncharacterized cupin superfamily protein